MDNLEAITRRIDALRGVAGVVRTMKTLSAVNLPPCEAAAASIDAYHETILDGLHAALRGLPGEARSRPQLGRGGPGGPDALIVFGADHGLCGGFNDAAAAEAGRAAGRDTAVLAVGARAAAALSRRGVAVAQTFRAAASPDGIGRLATALLIALDQAGGGLGPELAVDLVHNARTRQGGVAARTAPLAPLDEKFFRALRARRWRRGGLPFHRMETGALFAELLRQHFFVSLYRAAAASLAAEHAARLALMSEAERSLDERLDDLTAESRRARQTMITDELMDVIGGFEALGGAARPGPDG